MQPLHWFSAVIGHRDVSVIGSCQALSPSLSDCIGWTEASPDERIIIMIDVVPPRLTQDVTLAHELNHAANWGDPAIEEAEDEAASAAVEKVFPVLRTYGLRWPRRPAGWARLERWARTGR